MPTGIYAVVKSFVYSGAQYFMFMDVDTSAAGMDFNTTSAVLIFNASISHQCESVTILNDTILENNETFFVQLETIDPAVNISLGSVPVTILDDDCECEKYVIMYCLLFYNLSILCSGNRPIAGDSVQHQ